MNDEAANRAKTAALSLLSKRAFSRAALFNRLKRMGHASAACEHAIAETVRLGLIDDHALAADVIDRELDKTPADRAYLERRLAARDVNPEAAQAALDDALRDRDPAADARVAATAILERMSENCTTDALIRRLASRLARRGFEEETALEAARAAVNAARRTD